MKPYMKSISIIFAASLCIGLLSSCPDATVTLVKDGRSIEACTETPCPCAFTTECPTGMQCLNGTCATQIPPLSDSSLSDVSGDTPTGDTGGDGVGPPDGLIGDGGPDGGPVVQPGDPGTPCIGNPDCKVGWCVKSPEGGYCAADCTDCPDQWVCKTMTQLGDPVDICVLNVNRLCQTCQDDTQCGNVGSDHCLEIGGGLFCSRACSTGGSECPTGYSCDSVMLDNGVVVEQCIPDNGTCDCTTVTAGQEKGCQLENAFGTCYGSATCDPTQGYVGCDAATAVEEICNGVDDDCDGGIDEGQVASACEITNAFGTCTGQETCQGPAGNVCTAKTPEAEACNGLDDDCDGGVDEDFIDADGLFYTPENCGSCGLDCLSKFQNAAAADCDVSSGTATCIVTACDSGYILVNGSCIDENATLCNECSTDAECFGTNSKCIQISATDPRTFCGRDCTGTGGLSANCPASYDCTDIGGGDLQCIPQSGSCDCTEANSGQTKACAITNALGICFGQETCDPAVGWAGCTAATPAEDLCDGVDNDCDGLLDEAETVGDACTVDNNEGSCAGVTICAGAGGVICDAQTPSPEECDGIDNDCDGAVDEGFATDVGGGVLKYGLSDQHCGACNYACPAVPNGTVSCDGTPATPVCAVDSCDDGYYAYLGITCLPLPTANQCAPCTSNADCQGPADTCVDEGAEGMFCGRDCAVGSIYDTAANPCSGNAGAQSCCPAGNTCESVSGALLCRPTSGTCSCTVDQYLEACSVTNGAGTCLGTRTCDLSGSGTWTGCTATTPSVELCDGVDNDCDGAVDGVDSSIDYSTTPDGVQACSTGPACSGDWVCSNASWGCTAQPATSEVCDGIDNNCDGSVDELFVSGGQYVDPEHCGACGLDCATLIPNSTAVDCQILVGVPTCVATSCAPGYFPFGSGSVCLGLPDNLCQSCSTDADCLVPSSTCITVGPESFCGRDCSAGSEFGTTCPGGYSCTNVGGGDLQCTPDASTCVCNSDTVGLQRSCPVGACTGLQTCENNAGTYEFDTCSAEGVIPDVCDGADNDCDGTVDEGFLVGGKYTADTNCGVCGNNCLLRWNEALQHATGACDGTLATPACYIASCSTEVVGPTTFEWVDSNQLEADGCECQRVQGNTTVDVPDTDFGGAPSDITIYADENCDGVDGVVNDALFVSAANAAAGNGTLANPYQTISLALAAFGGSGADYILVAAGVYEENITITEGVELHGGYAPGFQSRNILTFQTIIRGQQPNFAGSVDPGTVNAEGITSQPTVISGFVIEGYDIGAIPGAGGGYVSYGVYALNSDDSLQIVNNRILGGLGGAGATGGNGTNGFGSNSGGGGALNGGNGSDSAQSGAFTCPSGCSGSVSGGSAGTNPQCTGANGIAGGAAGCPVYDQPSYVQPDPTKDGAPGYAWTRDGMTSGTSCASHLTEAGFPANIKKLDGLNGADGGAGPAGTQGNGCSAGSGGFAGGEWVASTGVSGSGAADGARGGTGAPSGGVDTASAAEMLGGVPPASGTRYRRGATGGGAGAGGCGGTGGGSGGSGGASIGLFVAWTAVPGAGSDPPVVRDNTVLRGPGGLGGGGGYGGSGGSGGDGGNGGDSNGMWVDFRSGDGGRGGNGGTGGGGGGGCGGASFGIVMFNYPAGWSVTVGADNVFTLPDSTNTGGSGGLGGPSGQTNASTDGTDGASANVQTVSN